MRQTMWWMCLGVVLVFWACDDAGNSENVPDSATMADASGAGGEGGAAAIDRGLGDSGLADSGLVDSQRRARRRL